MGLLNFSLMIILIGFSTVFCATIRTIPTIQPPTGNISDEDAEPEFNIEDRILNGLIAKPKSFPYVVSLQEKDEDGTEKFCGGVILAPTWILTAAHCYEDIESSTNFKNDFRVKAGVVEAFSKEATAQFIRVQKIILHPEYDPDTSANDVALLELSQPFKYNKYVRSIDLPPKNYSATLTGLIVGWGAIDQAEEIQSKVLRFAELPVSKRATCRKFFETITDNQLCLGYKSKQNACAGDSGGPFIQFINGKPAVVGVTSFGTQGCHEDDPIVYTNVASYLSFIKNTIDQNTPKQISPMGSPQVTSLRMEYPSLAALMEINADGDSYEKICTGVIIHDQFVLTTADCFDNTDETYFRRVRVQVGTTIIDNSKQGDLYEVLQIQTHPQYNISDSEMKHNLAMVKIMGLFKLSANVQKAFLPPFYFNFEAINGKIVGWDENNSRYQFIVSNVKNGNLESCKQLYPNATNTSVLCLERTGGVCNHDSGSPLMVKSQNGDFVIGLNTFFDTNCDQNQPFLMLNILHYTNFIDDVFNNSISKE